MRTPLLGWIKSLLKKVPGSLGCLSPERLELALKVFREDCWNLKKRTCEAWSEIEPPRITRRFRGWAFVRSQRTALWVSHTIRLVEAISDWNFSEYCLLSSGEPFLLMRREGNVVTVTAVTGPFQDIVMRCDTAVDFQDLPPPIQTCVSALLQRVLDIREVRAAKMQIIQQTLENS